MTILPIDTITALSSCNEEMTEDLNKIKEQGLRIISETDFYKLVVKLRDRLETLGVDTSNENLIKLNNFINDVYILFSLAK